MGFCLTHRIFRFHHSRIGVQKTVVFKRVLDQSGGVSLRVKLENLDALLYAVQISHCRLSRNLQRKSVDGEAQEQHQSGTARK